MDENNNPKPSGLSMLDSPIQKGDCTVHVFQFDREKYIHLMKSKGITAALTQLHTDTIRWEYEAFEGEKGYQPDMWNALQEVRNFSRELWEISLDNLESGPH